ncbi:MAG: Adenosylhopane nucleosidase, HpnG [Nevskia sp.]|nr:Adenosylhopane nucleosidase, HpnG [Nevskia sp.]
MGADALPATRRKQRRLKRLGIVVALPDEARSLLGRRAAVGTVADLSAGVVVAVGGLGAVAAERAAISLVDSGVTALMSWGTAGGLDPALAAGALLLPREVLDAHGGRYAVDAAWHGRLQRGFAGVSPVGAGGLMTVAEPLVSVSAKRKAFARHPVDGVDMESYAIASVAVMRGLPFAVVRAVIDAADRALPEVVQIALDEQGELRPKAIAAALLRRPQDLLGMLLVARHFASAERSLKAAAALGTAQAFWAPAAPLDQAKAIAA